MILYISHDFRIITSLTSAIDFPKILSLAILSSINFPSFSIPFFLLSRVQVVCHTSCTNDLHLSSILLPSLTSPAMTRVPPQFAPEFMIPKLLPLRILPQTQYETKTETEEDKEAEKEKR
jgi:hypothetical protein